MNRWSHETGQRSRKGHIDVTREDETWYVLKCDKMVMTEMSGHAALVQGACLQMLMKLWIQT